MSQVVTAQQLIPASVPEVGVPDDGATGGELKPLYAYEPDEESILAALLPRTVAKQLYTALLENAAREHGARMTPMASATPNARQVTQPHTTTTNTPTLAENTQRTTENN